MDTKPPPDPGYQTEISKETSYVMAYKPDYSLKRTIGVEVALNDIFTREKIDASNKILEIGRNCFFMDAEEEVNTIAELIAKPDESGKSLQTAASLAAALKGEAEMYGFSHIYKVCAFLMDACESREKPDIRTPLILDLVNALTSSIKKKISDDGGKEEKAIMANLACLEALAKPKSKEPSPPKSERTAVCTKT